ncbi:MAG: DUF2798 domain-containing protein [Undibacterium sp.]|nr:DUF2798 domain-containing protein [Undibacterium sp.]
METQKNTPLVPSVSWKIPKRFTMLVFAFYMAALMACLMCMVIVAVNTGVEEGFFSRVWKAYKVAMPVAVVCVTLVRPIVMRLVAWTVAR